MKCFKFLMLAVGVGALLTACDDKENTNPVGSWVSAAPESVTSSIADAAAATKMLSIDFVAAKDNQPGVVTLTADYDVIGTDSLATTYKVNTSIKGTWTRDAKDDDEYVIAFDSNSLTVSGTDAPVLGPITDNFTSSLASFTKIEDVKVSKDGKQMSFETDKPEVKYQFVSK